VFSLLCERMVHFELHADRSFGGKQVALLHFERKHFKGVTDAPSLTIIGRDARCASSTRADT